MNNIDNNKNMLDDMFDAASKHIQDFIISDLYQRLIINIEDKFSLTEKETREIQLKTFVYLLGALKKDDTISDIVVVLRNRTAAEIEKIIDEIDKKILSIK